MHFETRNIYIRKINAENTVVAKTYIYKLWLWNMDVLYISWPTLQRRFYFYVKCFSLWHLSSKHEFH